MTHLSLRGSGEAFLAACENALGVRPPVAANTVASAAGTSILWLGPDEWLLIGPVQVDDLKKALRGIHSAVVDVTSSRKALVVSGARSEEILSKAATLDFSLQDFPIGSCAQTNIARTQGIIHRVGAEEFVLYVRSSFAAYLAAWLEDAKA